MPIFTRAIALNGSSLFFLQARKYSESTNLSWPVIIYYLQLSELPQFPFTSSETTHIFTPRAMGIKPQDRAAKVSSSMTLKEKTTSSMVSID